MPWIICWVRSSAITRFSIGPITSNLQFRLPIPDARLLPMFKESALASGCKSRADWLAALKQTDLAANGKRLFTAKTLFSNLLASAP